MAQAQQTNNKSSTTMTPNQYLETWNNQIAQAIKNKITGLSKSEVQRRMTERGLDPKALDDDNNENHDTYGTYFKMLRPKINNIRSIVESLPLKLERVVRMWLNINTIATQHIEPTEKDMDQLIQDGIMLMPKWVTMEVKRIQAIHRNTSKRKYETEGSSEGCSEGSSSKRQRGVWEKEEVDYESKEEKDHRMFKALEQWVLKNMKAQDRVRALNGTLANGTEVRVTFKTLRRLFPDLHSMLSTEATVCASHQNGYRLGFELSSNVDVRNQVDVNYNEEEAFDREVVTFESKEDGGSRASAAKGKQLKQVDVPKSDVYTMDEPVGVQAVIQALPADLEVYYVRYVRIFTHVFDVLAENEVVSGICETLQEYYENKEYDADHFNDMAQAKAERWESNAATACEWEKTWGKLHTDHDTDSFTGLMTVLQETDIAMDLELGD